MPGPLHLVLVGMPGSGKSSVARRLARRGRWRVVDLDDEIERAEGRTIPEIFAADGEHGFRDVEAQVLRDALASSSPAVIATGGGAVLREDNRVEMRRHATVVWLRAGVEALAARVGDGSSRPLLAADPRANLQRLHDERAGAYAAAAHAVVDVDGVPFDEITDRVLAAAGATAQGATAEADR